MTLASENYQNHYTGNGATSSYSFTFKAFDDDDLTIDIYDTDDAKTTLTKTTHYTVTFNADLTGSISLVNSSAFTWLTSGSLKSNYVIHIHRLMDLTQTTDIRNAGPFLPETHEDQFDKLVMNDQQIDGQVQRSIRLPGSEDEDDYTLTLPAEADRASKVLSFDADGNVTATASVPTSGVTASSFAETVLDDTSAAAMIVTIGAGLGSVSEETAPANNDLVAIYDTSESATNRMTLNNLMLTPWIMTVSAKTSAYPVVADDNHKIFTNEGASASVAITLPTAVTGYEITFIVQDADGIVVTANTGDTINIGGVVSASAGTATSTQLGSALKLVSINATEWVAVSYTGTWLVA